MNRRLLYLATATVLDGRREAGSHRLKVDGSGLSTGIDLCRIWTSRKTETTKIFRLR